MPRAGGKKDEAWSIFWEIMERVDKENYAAVLNLVDMANRDYGRAERYLRRAIATGKTK